MENAMFVSKEILSSLKKKGRSPVLWENMDELGDYCVK